jgi:hypothetical protein
MKPRELAIHLIQAAERHSDATGDDQLPGDLEEILTALIRTLGVKDSARALERLLGDELGEEFEGPIQDALK